MNKQVLKELKQRYGLLKFEIDIISKLQEKELNADEICKVTKISKGRIYNFLNSLLAKKLIEKNEKNPATYTAQNFEEKVMDFLERRFYSAQQKENDMILLLNQFNTGTIEVIDTSTKYIETVYRVLEPTKEMNVILRQGIAPFVFYPRNREDYFNVRKDINKKRPAFTGVDEKSYQFHECYHELSHSRKINYVLDEASVKNHIAVLRSYFGNIKFKSFVKMVLKTIKRDKIGIRIFKDNFPYSLYVTDNNAMIALVYKKSIVGITTTNKQIIEIYQNIFKKSYSQGIPIEKFIKEKYGIS